MTKKKINIFLLCLTIILIIILFAYLSYLKNNCKKLSCLNFPGKDNWKTDEVYTDAKNIWKGMFSSGNYKIRVYELNNINKLDADNFTKITLMTTKGLFDTAKNPYAGVLSDKIVCPENLKPIEEDFVNKSNINVHFIRSYLNARLQYGACTESQILYKVYSAVLYCDNKRDWFQIEIITPLNDTKTVDYFKSLFNEASCK